MSNKSCADEFVEVVDALVSIRTDLCKYSSQHHHLRARFVTTTLGCIVDTADDFDSSVVVVAIVDFPQNDTTPFWLLNGLVQQILLSLRLSVLSSSFERVPSAWMQGR